MAKTYRQFSLTLTVEDDQAVIDRLDSLPRGQMAAWVKEAIREKMAREEA